MNPYIDRLMTATEESLPTLDEVVLGTLSFLDTVSIPTIDIHAHKRPLVIGSVNALSTGRILFRESDAVFADEGTYTTIIDRMPSIDAVYIISASGSKHAIDSAQHIQKSGKPAYLITSNENAPARVYMDDAHVFVFPHIREPYTYNTSTYFSMLLSGGHESSRAILTHIEKVIQPLVHTNMLEGTSFVFTVPPQYGAVRSMFTTKFDELFAPRVTGRSFTHEEIKHAKIVFPSDTQYFFNLGVTDTEYAPSTQQINIPLPENHGPVAMLAIGYYIIGCIQRSHPPYFMEAIPEYLARAQEVFGQTMSIIVE
jgi:hypothetical protein